MADRIICPVCGESNPADMEFCRNCQSRLQPIGEENEAIQPGQFPTKKTTSELEPLLPQWLRDARQKARDSESQQDASEQQPTTAPEPSAPDLLAGLASQGSDEEEEIPDWLAQITGAETKKKKPPADEKQVKWVELGRGDEQHESLSDVGGQASTAEPPSDSLGDWFRQASASTDAADFRMPATPQEVQPPAVAAAPSESEDLGWLRSLDAAAASKDELPAAAPRVPDETPDWLKKLQKEQAPAEEPQAPAQATPREGPIPDWLKDFGDGTLASQLPETPAAQSPASEEPLFEPVLPDWLKSAEPSVNETAQPAPTHEEAATPVELPDWLSALESKEPEQPAEEPTDTVLPAPETPETLIPGELPAWISALGGGAPQTPSDEPVKLGSLGPESPEAGVPGQLPDWISALGSKQPEPLAEELSSPAFPVPEARTPESSPPPPPAETPDWLASLRAEQEAPKEDASPFAAEELETTVETPAAPVEMPDWFSSLSMPQEQPKEEVARASEPMTELQPPAQELPSPSAPLTSEPASGEDADAIFASMQTPDWLSAVLPPSTAAEENVPAAAQEEEPIVPAELPSWIQALRPVESAMATVPSAAEDVPTEAKGPLAGLHGVLPVIPGAAVPSSKPKAHSMKLDATEQQQAHAALLEQILAAETSPVPMRAGGQLLRSQRVLRWLLSALVIAVLGGVVFARSEAFQLPSNVPNETVAAIQAVESIPDGAPVLMVFDYQPATVGEMEATGASLIDHLLLLKHPNVALLSTSPTGPALAEHFMSSALADRAYVQGTQYVNLGFLPGGLAGVYNFAQSPATTVPLDAASKPVWQSAVLSRVQRFSDFAAIIVLTDSMESGRTWVEQTQVSRGNSLLLFVSSAQAGPMLMPYVDSGQVNGMVSGIYGAAGAEQRNAGSPGVYGLPGAEPSNSRAPGYVRRYWDAYNAGLYLAVMAIVVGAVANLWLGLRDRQVNAAG